MATANDLNISQAGMVAFDGTATFFGRTLIGGTGIIISNGNGVSGNPTISATATGTTWTDESSNFNALSGNGYFITATATATLPALPSQGNTIQFIVDVDPGTGLLTITANTGQMIRLGTTISASAGTCVNTQHGDAINLVYRSSDTTWIAEGGVIGGWNIT